MTQNVVQRFSAPTQAAAILILLLHSGACGPAWLAKQAEFAVENCTALDGAPELSSWRWKVDPDPVLTRGPKGAWDSFDVLNPSVVFWNGLYYNLYSGFDGHTWRTGLATSVDGRHWEKFAGNPVLSPLPGSWEGDYIAANGSALHDGSQFLYWYHAGRPARIGLARSTDARHWQRLGPPVLEPGPEGSWDESGVADPYVLRCRDAYYLYYLGQNRRAVQRIGAARSPDGIHWQKFIGNPVLEPGPPGAFDERGVGEPAVFRAATEFYMIYTGRSAGETRRLGAARSSDGVHWQRAALAATIASGQPWDSHVVCDPSVLAVNGKLWLWFGGGDVARPDERLHGQIGLATASLNGR